MRLLSVGDAADRLQVSSGTVRNWIDKGHIKAVRLPSGHRRIPEAELGRIEESMFDDMAQGRTMNLAGTFTEQALNQIVQRIIQVADPVRIVLFGSAARGEMGSDSDADFLVEVKAPAHRREIATKIRAVLRDIRFPLDIVVVTTEDIEHFGDSPATVIFPAVEEGRVLYVA